MLSIDANALLLRCIAVYRDGLAKIKSINLLRDSTKDTANKRSLDLCATIVHVSLGG
jgi:hypothetical protein